MAKLEIERDDISRVAARISDIRQRAEKPSLALWRKIGSYMRQVYRRQFATEGAYLLGRRWKPLSPEYASWKIAQGKRSKMLNFSGDLRRSYTVEGLADTTVFGPNSVAFGSNHPLAPFHEYGTHDHRTGRPVIPARPVVVETPKMHRDIKKIVRDYLVNKRAPLPEL